MTLNGSNKEIIDVFDECKDPECSSTIFGKKINNIKVKSNFDNEKVGKYKIIYEITFLKTKKVIIRKIEVADNVSPIITLNGDNEVTITVGDEYKEQGVLAVDNYDKDLSEFVKVESNLNINKVGEYQINYNVEDSSKNKASITRKVIVKEKQVIKTFNNYSNNKTETPTYINGILIVNKSYGLPSSYSPGVNSVAYSHLQQLQEAAKQVGFSIPTLSGYRSYETQRILYNNYYARDGAIADTYSARPGHSEHQTGLAFDVGAIDDNYGSTPQGQWLSQNCSEYGFIVRYPKGKENITGYQYEPWHIRYVGVDIARDITSRNITLEEYLGV